MGLKAKEGKRRRGKKGQGVAKRMQGLSVKTVTEQLRKAVKELN